MAEIDLLFRRAEEAFNKRNYDYARDLFSQIILLNPNHVQSRKGLRAAIVTKYRTSGGAPGKIKLFAMGSQTKAQMGMARNNPQKRIELAQKYLIDDPDNSDIRSALAEALLALGHQEGAAAEAEMCFESDPKNVAAAKVLCAAYKGLGRVKEAQEILSRISKHVPEDRDLERMQRDLAAIATTDKGFKEASETKDGYRSVMKNTAVAEQLERKQHLIKTDDDARAFITDLTQEFQATPDYKIARRIGDTYLDFLKDPNGAKDWFKKASELNPQDSTLRDRMEDCTLRLYDLQILQADQAKDPRITELKAKKIAFQIQSFERRVKDRPTDMNARFELGRAYYLSGKTENLDKAIAEFQHAVKDPKRAIDSHFYLGIGFQKKKLFDMADAQYEKAEGAGILAQGRRLEILYHRARCSAEAGKFPRAVELGKKILEIDFSFRDISGLVESWTAQVK